MTSMSPQAAVLEMPLPDHVMILLDDQTYREVADSEFLATQFARLQPKAADSSLAGRYASLGLAGTSTLVELFRGIIPGPRRFTAGLVFSFEQPGAVPSARRALQERAGIPALYQLVERGTPQGPAPWYHLLAPDLGADSPLLVMLNQVTPEYYQGLGARPGPQGELRRSAYLDAVLDGGGAPASPSADRMLGDVVSVTVRVRAERAERLSAVLTTLGYQLVDGVLRGPQFTVRLDVDDSAPEGVTEVSAGLTQAPAERQELCFGPDSRLTLDPAGTARWTFTPAA